MRPTPSPASDITTSVTPPKLSICSCSCARRRKATGRRRKRRSSRASSTISSSTTSRLRSEPDHDPARLDRDRLDRIREWPAKDAQGPGVEEDPEQHRREALPPDRELSNVQPEVTPLPSCDAWLDAGVSAYPEPYRALEQYRGQHVAQPGQRRSEEHTSELQSRLHLVCRLLL